MATYETNNNNNNVYEEDRSSEISKEFSSSASSVGEDTKKITFNDDKEAKSLSSSKRKKRNSFISKFSKKDDKEKEEKEKHHSEKHHSEGGGLTRTLSGIFSNKDKDNNKRNNTVESENQLRPPLSSSFNSDSSKNRHSFVFTSDGEEKLEIDTSSKKGRKSRQSSNAEGLEKSKKENRLSVLGKIMGNKSSQKSKNDKNDKNDVWEDSFLEPDETNFSPSSMKNPFPSLKIKQNNSGNDNYFTKDYVDSPQAIHHNNSIIGIIGTGINPPKSITDDGPVDDVQSTSSSTQPSSLDDEVSSSPTTPITPIVIVTPNEPDSQNEFDNKVQQKEHDWKEDEVDQNNSINSTVESRIIAPFSTNNVKSDVVDFDEQDEQQQGYDNNTKVLQELEKLNKSLVNSKEQLEAKVAEQDSQINKFNSMEQIMQQQIDLSKRMSETMQRLESKVNVPKEEHDSLSTGRIFEDTIKRLESKIDRQNDEIIRLKSVVGQLSGGNRRLSLTNGDTSHQDLIVARQGERALIQTNHSQSPQIYSKRTLVSTLVVSPLCSTITISASIATSVLYAVYVRPVVGLVSVLRDISTTKYETAD